MKKYFIAALIILFVVTVFFFIIQNKKLADAEDIMSNAFDQVLSEAETANTGENTAVTLQEIAAQNVVEIIEQQATPLKKQQAAASAFMGFYLANYRQRAEYCLLSGVDLINFKKIFKDTHAHEMAMAQKVLFKQLNDIDSFYESAKAVMEKAIAQDMNSMASIYEQTTMEACQTLEDNAEIFIEQMQLSKTLPAVYQQLNIPLATP